MSSSDAARRSKRIMGEEPEYEPLEDPEQIARASSKLSPGLHSSSLPKKSKEPNHLSKIIDHNSRRNERQTYVSSFHGDVTHSQNAELSSNQKLNKRNGKGPSGIKETRCHLSQTFIAKSSNPASFLSRVFEYLRMWHVFLIVILTLIVLLILSVLAWVNSKPDENYYASFDSVKKQFPHQSNNLWGFVSYGMNSSEPFVLLLVHENQDDLVTCLANRTAGIVVQSRTKIPVDPIIIDGRQENVRERFLTLRSQMENRRAMVLLHLEDLSTDVADYLHFILDVHEPWVPGGVYVLTLNVPNQNGNSQTTFARVESFLQEKWPGVDEDNFPALISRISNFEYVVQKGNNPC